MDNKQIDKINIMKTYLPKCISTYDTYVYGTIPQNKFLNACNAYAGKVQYNETIGLIDETVFGSGKKGFLFTFDGYYYDGCSSIKLYKNNMKFNSLKSPYNMAMMNEMLQKLYEIETRKSKLENFLDTTFEIGETILDNIDDIGNIAEYVVDELTGDAYSLEFVQTDDDRENMKQILTIIDKCIKFIEKLSKSSERVRNTIKTPQEDTTLGLFCTYMEKARSGFAQEIDEIIETLISGFKIDDEYELTLSDAIDIFDGNIEDCYASDTNKLKQQLLLLEKILSHISETICRIKNHFNSLIADF